MPGYHEVAAIFRSTLKKYRPSGLRHGVYKRMKVHVGGQMERTWFLFLDFTAKRERVEGGMLKEQIWLGYSMKWLEDGRSSVHGVAPNVAEAASSQGRRDAY